MTEYDNTNKGSLWETRAARGNVNVQGNVFYAALVQTGRDAPAPSHTLYMTSAVSRQCTETAMFRPKREGSKAIANGKLVLGQDEFWVNAFVNESTHAQSPLLDVSLQPVEPQRQAPQPQPSREQSPPANGYEQPRHDNAPAPPSYDDAPSGDNIPF